ncbi:hypothetical protein RR47_GL001843 [Enterococcus columbae DSM 7374 = ATCC 51263]|nr:hypothetical protein RR47_GL001843 [Enterococcus columbae DSM 7374 = ATCC 51263]
MFQHKLLKLFNQKNYIFKKFFVNNYVKKFLKKCKEKTL